MVSLAHQSRIAIKQGFPVNELFSRLHYLRPTAFRLLKRSRPLRGTYTDIL